MSLKVLEISAKQGTQVLGQLYVGVPDLLRLIHFPQGTNAIGAGTLQAPFSGMKQVADWGKAVDSLKGLPEQWIRFGGVMVKKAAGSQDSEGQTTGSYYMNAEGIVTDGVKDRGGPSYNELGGLLKGLKLSDADIAVGVRNILCGKAPSDASDTSKALACLTAAMFLAEPRRNARAFAINLMLLDFVEAGVTYGSSNRDFSWQNILWRTAFGREGNAKTKVYRFESGNKDLSPHERGGKLPMSNTDASEQSRATIPAHPVNGATILMPNSEMEKEGSILVRWLQHYLNKENAKHTAVESKLGLGNTMAEKEKNRTTTTTQTSFVYTGLKAAPPNTAYASLDAKGTGSIPFAVKQIRDAINLRCWGLDRKI